MNITIAGIGNAGTTIAADLSQKGHQITLLKTSTSNLHNAHYEYLKENKTVHVKDLNESYIAKIKDITTDCKSAIQSADIVILYIQTNYHEIFIKRIAQYIKDGQTFIIEPGYLSTCFFLKYTQKKITIIEAESSPIDCRITSPGHVQIYFKNVLNPFGVFPKTDQEKANKILRELGYPYILTKNVVEAALHNPNLIVHTVGALFSIPRIEHTQGKNYSMYKEVFTPSIWNIVEGLDNEKMEILNYMGCTKLSYVEACKLRNSSDNQREALSVFFEYAKNSAPDGPNISNSRYITEDIPQGLVMLESLGKVFNIPTPICSSLINLSSTALLKDFREKGRTVELLGLENIQKIIKY